MEVIPTLKSVEHQNLCHVDMLIDPSGKFNRSWQPSQTCQAEFPRARVLGRVLRGATRPYGILPTFDCNASRASGTKLQRYLHLHNAKTVYGWISKYKPILRDASFEREQQLSLMPNSKTSLPLTILWLMVTYDSPDGTKKLDSNTNLLHRNTKMIMIHC